MKRQIVFGMGAGHCGSLLLAQILDRQPHASVTHEKPPFLPWVVQPDAPGIAERIERMLRTSKARIIGDVASFYLPYAERAIECDPEIRIICLKRPKEEIVAAFCRHLDQSSPLAINHWAQEPAPGWTHDFLWTRIYPQYDTQDRVEGISRYWDEYYSRVDELLPRFPKNLRLWDTEILTSEDGVREVLNFIGIPRGDQVLLTGRPPANLDLTIPQRSPAPRYTHPLDPRKCVILVPFQGFIHRECDDALKELERRHYQVRRVGGYAAIDQGRNQMATDALLDGFEETFWIDADVAFHPDAVDQLRTHPHPIVCGVYPQKGRRALATHVAPGTPSMTFGKQGGLVELLYAATGFLLVRREVYLTIFEKLQLQVCNERFGHPTIPFFLPMVRPIEEGYWYLAEDYAFCERARRCGFKIYADTTIRLWHIGNYRYGWEDAGLERQRFTSFTLNFGDMPMSHETATEKPPALANLAAEYPWPEKKPEPAAFPYRDWLYPGTRELLSRTVAPNSRLIVEVGSWTGRSTRFLAGLAPQATVIAIDHWQGSEEHREDSELAPLLPKLYETFLAESWDFRDQIVPLRADSTVGLERIAEAGLEPDLVYLDGDHSYEGLRRDLTKALDLFPGAMIVGDDLDWETVRKALEDVVRERGLSCEGVGNAWKITRPGKG